MTGLPENVEELLTSLIEKSRHEMNILMALSDAIRRTDEQMLREVRSVTLHHELRREQIKGELQALATRLCSLPARPVSTNANTLHRHPPAISSAAEEAATETVPAWSNTVRQIDEELAETFADSGPRH